jgi:hypothetical protein
MANAAGWLLTMHPTSASAKRNWSGWGHQLTPGRAGMNVSLGENLIYVQTNNGVAHDGIDCELALDPMVEQQDAAAVDGNDVANHYAAT